MQRTNKRFNDCGLSTSLYLTSYTDSLTDNAKKGLTNSIPAMDDYDFAIATVSKEPVMFYIGDGDHDSCHGDDPCYEEECHYGLQRLLSPSLYRQVQALFGSAFGLTTIIVGLDDIFQSVITELLHLSEDEPYGVSGANLILVLDKPCKTGSRKSSVLSTASSISSTGSDDHHQPEPKKSDILGTIKLCPETVTTFELVLALREEKNIGVIIRNWMANVFRSKQIVVIEPTFTLRKKKLYRSS